jgi:hypothetical protein
MAESWMEAMKGRAAAAFKELREGREKARALLADLENAGFVLGLDGAQLLVSPGSKLSPGHKEAIRGSKPDLVALMKERVQPERPAVKEEAAPNPPRHPAPGPEDWLGMGPAPDYRDWRLEWIYRVGILYLRIQECPMADVTTMGELFDLTNARPKSLAECLEWGRQVNEVEHRERKLGCLPPYPWPDREPRKEEPDAQPPDAPRPRDGE